ncbi:hypothetical protein [uncultured Paludibaculum sp.]|uniref:hypothetical protein n=1 Tax=uncultured Paludibaculum sp. TaxID=1765020 RepID=UPI002AAC48C0|nr:hypothetical protein [uncultured Paludibaculum sp.]
MKKLIVVLVALVLTAGAQEKKYLQKVFDVKYVDVNALQELVRASVRDAKVNANKELKALSVGTYNDFDMQTAEELVKRYDVPRGSAPSGNRNIELIAYLMMAAPTGNVGDAVPADLDPVVKQLKNLFGYTDFRLLDSAVLRAREGQEAETSGNVGRITEQIPRIASYQLSYRNAAVVASDQTVVIRFDKFRFHLRLPIASGVDANGKPNGFEVSDIGFSTNLDIRAGQKVVVGKAKTGSDKTAFILVLTAKAVD